MCIRSMIIITLAVSVVTAAAGISDASSSRVAVTPFAGPGDVARAAHAAVVEITASRYEVVPSIEILEASAEAGADARSPLAAMRVAQITGADALVIGRVAPSGDGYKLTLGVREPSSGRSIGAVLVPMFAETVEQGTYDQLEPLLLHLLSSVVMVGGQRPVNEPRVLASPPESKPRRADEHDDQADADDDAEVETIDMPFNLVAAAGLSATARRLSFTQEADLANAGLSSSPTAGVRFEAEARTKGKDHLGLALSFDRTIGGKLAYRESGAASEIGLSQMEWGLGLRGRVMLRRFEVVAKLGYNELIYRLTLPPAGFALPDAAYSFIDLGAGVGTRFSDGVVKLSASARYLHVLSSSGITDPTSFGRATSRGFDTEIGIELRVTDSVFVRMAGTYLRFVHSFDGSGALISNLDDDPEPDVAGAADVFVGAHAQLAFVL